MRLPTIFISLALATICLGQQAWYGYAGDPWHSGQSRVASRKLDKVVWAQTVDQLPEDQRYYDHYGAPSITPLNTVVVAVKTGPNGAHRVSALNGEDGSRKWTASSSYRSQQNRPFFFCTTLVPPHDNESQYGITWPESGGRVSVRSNADSNTGTHAIYTFYGANNYRQNRAFLDANVYIVTPITAGADGSLYFGYKVEQSNDLGLTNGIAKVNPDGTCLHTSAMELSGTTSQFHMANDEAPALTRDGRNLYVVIRPESLEKRQRLVRIDPSTLKPVNSVEFINPTDPTFDFVVEGGTQSPMVAPDGDVYIGSGSGNSSVEGFLYHFSKDLSERKLSGGFGWDTTPSVVPAQLVPWYTGTSKYLLFSKYNNYNNGQHRIALLDPNESEISPETGIAVMKVVASQLSPTGSADYRDEWCINAAVVDIKRKCVLMNNANGYVYRWDLVTNTLSESVQITVPYYQAYTSTVIGPDGKIYAIHSNRLFAIGSHPGL